MDIRDIENGEQPTGVRTQLVVSNTKAGDGDVLVTPSMHRNIVLQAITPLAVILIRASKAYLQTLVGLLSAAGLGMASSTLPAGDFVHTLKVCAGLAVASGVMSLLTNVLVLLTALGEKFPTLKA